MASFSEHFGIPKNPPIEFVDIPMDNDLLAFIDPFLIANNRHIRIVNAVYLRLTAFFTKLNRDYIVLNDQINGLRFLDKLHEPNEYHLGYSDANKGAAISNVRAGTIFNALSNNIFARSNNVTITNEAHNVLLLVAGIGQDIMSDTIANVCRDIFAQFTNEQCVKHGIQTTIFQRHYFNSATDRWENENFELPSYLGKPIILLPEEIASSLRNYTNNYNHFIAGNYIASDILNGKIAVAPNSLFIRTLKDGTLRAVVKRIVEVYGRPKSELVQFVLDYNDSLGTFLDYAKTHYPALNL